MRTPYSSANAGFSNDAHLAAQKLLYPDLFGTDKLEFEDTLVGTGDHNDILDGQMGVDRLISVSVGGLTRPLSFTIQERFRRGRYKRYRDITITEWNMNSNLPSELYKIKAGIFVYGYYAAMPEPHGCFFEAIAVNTDNLKLAIAHNYLEYTREINTKNQTFIAVKFDSLFNANLVIKHWENRQ